MMMKTKLILGWMLLLFANCTDQRAIISDDFLEQSKQLVIAISPDSKATTGKLGYFERSGEEWKQVGATFDVSFGRTGLAWGTGLHEAQPGNQKKEGDGKSPSGIFRFGTAFGYAPVEETNFLLPYVQATEWLECVDDGASAQYNLLVDNRNVSKDWNSSEFMRLPDHQYQWGIFVEHNTPPAQGGGSCIFFHIWKNPGSATSGCTAMPEENLLDIMRWLDPAKQPLLIQLTEKDYRHFQKRHGLPRLE